MIKQSQRADDFKYACTRWRTTSVGSVSICGFWGCAHVPSSATVCACALQVWQTRGSRLEIKTWCGTWLVIRLELKQKGERRDSGGEDGGGVGVGCRAAVPSRHEAHLSHWLVSPRRTAATSGRCEQGGTRATSNTRVTPWKTRNRSQGPRSRQTVVSIHTQVDRSLSCEDLTSLVMCESQPGVSRHKSQTLSE